MPNAFSIGQLVCLIADPSRVGPILEVLPSVPGRIGYRVFHAPGEIREYLEEQLAIADAGGRATAYADYLSPKSLLPADEFRVRLTACRLASPLTDNLYALHAARIKFIPFQFKPLLRLLRSDRPRMLIADEVGVGKTIEAGLILKELQSRQRLDNVLIVCPKALVSKWQAEMRRFDEDFHPLTADTLRWCLNETYRDGAWPLKYSRAIVHLELFRIPDYLFGAEQRPSRPGLATLQPPAQFSLAIFDEAHHLRNTESNSNQLARFICDNSEAALFLSATPVQLGSRNLFALLNLLRPDLFPDQTVFNEMVEPNRHLNQAMRHVRSRNPNDTWQRDSAYALSQAAATTWGTRYLQTDPRFHECTQTLTKQTSLSNEERIRCLRDLEELHTLAHVMNRTRRKDIGRFTLREPRTINVSFTPEQESFYRELLSFRKQVLLLRYDPIVIRLIMDTLERQASSCLPALMPTLDGFLKTGRFSISQVSDATEEEDGEFDMPPAIREQAQRLRELAKQLPPHDPKLNALLSIAQTTRESEGSGKLLIFSFFLHTLHYLTGKLRDAGYRVGIVTGQVEEEEREELRNRFRKPNTDPNALDILLSSEVGCEGLDYEFCDRMVNYDIPWNPMRLEQRIGRIDRFGQPAEKVFIFNFVTPGTVEERIFFRCFERLGIFRDTVGDCEEVLGEQAVTEQLLEIARNPNLRPEQAEEKARQIADNAVRLVEEQRRLEGEGSSLLGLDQALIQEVGDIDAQGRFVSAEELRTMIEYYITQPDIGGKLDADKQSPGLYRLRLNQQSRTALSNKLRNLKPTDRTLTEFRRKLDADEPHLTLTFNQEIALEQRSIPFITPVHPLARIATEHLKQRHKPLATHVRVRTNDLPSGTYAFACELWETIAIKPEVRLTSIAYKIDDKRPAPEVASQVLRLLQHAEPVNNVHSIKIDAVSAAMSSLDEAIHQAREAAVNALLARNEQLIVRKLASLEAYNQNRLARLDRELASTHEERITRMKTSEKARAEADHANRRAELEQRRNADIVRERIAIGILEISNA